jgi:hypothetical protein
MASRNRLAGTKRSSSIEEEEDGAVDDTNHTGASSEHDSSSHYTGSYGVPEAGRSDDLAPEGLSIDQDKGKGKGKAKAKGKGKAKVTESRKRLKKMQSAGALVEGRAFGGLMRSHQAQ